MTVLFMVAPGAVGHSHDLEISRHFDSRLSQMPLAVSEDGLRRESGRTCIYQRISRASEKGQV